MRVKRLIKNVAFPLLCTPVSHFTANLRSVSRLSNEQAIEKRLFSTEPTHTNRNDGNHNGNTEGSAGTDPSKPDGNDDDDDFYYYAPFFYLLYINCLSISEKKRDKRIYEYNAMMNREKEETPIIDGSTESDNGNFNTEEKTDLTEFDQKVDNKDGK